MLLKIIFKLIQKRMSYLEKENESLRKRLEISIREIEESNKVNARLCMQFDLKYPMEWKIW